MLDEGVHGTVRLQSLYKAITWPKVGNISVCPVCEWESNTHLLPHLLEIHLQLREEDIITSASTRDILLVANQVHYLKTVVVPSLVLPYFCHFLVLL